MPAGQTRVSVACRPAHPGLHRGHARAPLLHACKPHTITITTHTHTHSYLHIPHLLCSHLLLLLLLLLTVHVQPGGEAGSAVDTPPGRVLSLPAEPCLSGGSALRVPSASLHAPHHNDRGGQVPGVRLDHPHQHCTNSSHCRRQGNGTSLALYQS